MFDLVVEAEEVNTRATLAPSVMVTLPLVPTNSVPPPHSACGAQSSGGRNSVLYDLLFVKSVPSGRVTLYSP